MRRRNGNFFYPTFRLGVGRAPFALCRGPRASSSSPRPPPRPPRVVSCCTTVTYLFATRQTDTRRPRKSFQCRTELFIARFSWNLPGRSPPAGESGGAAAGDTLKQFHAASSSLKSMCTGFVAAGIEDCRKACGGHGFLQSSGLPEFLGSYLQACTVEGENHMLTQQVTAQRLLGRVLCFFVILSVSPAVKQASMFAGFRVVRGSGRSR